MKRFTCQNGELCCEDVRLRDIAIRTKVEEDV